MPRARRWSVAQATQYHLEGWTWQQIADHYGVAGESTIREGVRRYQARGRDTSRTTAALTASTARWGAPRNAVARILASRGRTFGIEIEFHTAIRSDVVRAVEAVVGYHIHMVGYHGNTCVTCHQTVSGYSKWKLETDSSATAGMANAGAQPHNQGGELVSPVFSDEDGLAEIKAVMSALRSVGAKVDRRHGLHVHIGAADIFGTRLIHLMQSYDKAQTVFYKLVAKSRKNNHFCRPNSSLELQQNVTAVSLGRQMPNREKYRGMNFAPMSRIGTIELRMHQGTLNGTKATEWIRFLLGFFNATQNGVILDEDYSNRLEELPEALFTKLREGGFITAETERYLNGRVNSLNRTLVTA